MFTRIATTRHALSNESSLLPFLYCTKTIVRGFSKTRHAKHPRGRDVESSAEVTRTQHGKQGYTVNEPWEDVWTRGSKEAPATTQNGSYIPFGPQGSRSDTDADLDEVGLPPRRRQGHSYGTRVRQSYLSDADVDMEGIDLPSAEHDYGHNIDGPQSSSRSRDQKAAAPYIPFERSSAGPRLDPYADLEGTTITPTEKNAFESLFKLKSSRVGISPDAKQRDGKTDTLSSILNAARANAQKERELSLDGRPKRLERPGPEMPAPLQALKEEAAAAFRHSTDPERARSMKRVPELSELDRAANKDIAEIKKSLSETETDVEVWRILCGDRLLGRVVALELDGPFKEAGAHLEKKRKKKEESKMLEISDHTVGAGLTDGTPSPATSIESLPQSSDYGDATLTDTTNSDGDPPSSASTPLSTSTPSSKTPKPTPLQVLTASLPTHLLNILQYLSKHYPSSPLPLQIIPLLKSIGPATAALGLSTPLYNAHMRLLWTQYSDLPTIISTLEEMDREVYEFDAGTMGLLKEILYEAREKRMGRDGRGLQAFWRMQGMRRGFDEVVGWRERVKERLEEAALRRVREEEVLRDGLGEIVKENSGVYRLRLEDLEEEEAPLTTVHPGT